MSFFDTVQAYQKHNMDIYPIEDGEFGDEFMIVKGGKDQTTISDYKYAKAWINGYNQARQEEAGIQKKAAELLHKLKHEGLIEEE